MVTLWIRRDRLNMFGTLKAGKKNNAGSMVFVEDNRPNRGTSGSPHIACKSCREKKLKCTGEPGGCKRCKSVNASCEYPSPTEDKRGNRSRRSTLPPATRQTPPPSSKIVVPQPVLEYPRSDVQSAMLGIESTNPNDLNLDFTVPSFVDTALSTSLDDEFAMMDDGSLMERISPNRSSSEEDPGFLSGHFDLDLLPELDSAFDPSQLADTSDSDNNFSAGTSLNSGPDAALLDTLLLPAARWQHTGAPVDFMTSSAMKPSQTIIRPRIHRTASSTPSSSSSSSSMGMNGPGQDTPMTSISGQQPLKRQSPDPSSSGSDSDSRNSQCRCIERALRLLERLPSLSSTSSTSSSRSGSDESPDGMDIAFECGDPPQPRPRTNGPGGPTFISAGSLFLSHFSRYVAVYSTVSSCQICLHKSSFAMVLLMLAQRLTSRVKLLLRQHSPIRKGDNKDLIAAANAKYTLTVGEHAVEYEDMTPLLSTLLAGKICRLAACIARVKAICVAARWTVYARGFEALELPLRERMGELEIMM
ncbi:hypothetical protein F4677DRAFT_261244 [Hypoxylon crocopeplum]|nr:hypothetical protein F4677DRAFT_261244 [Hypoxylon crocopeplum]